MVEMLKQSETKEKSDSQKLKEIQGFVENMNDFWLRWDNDETISIWDNKLKIDGFVWDGWSFVKIILSKNWKETFNYNMNYDMFHDNKDIYWNKTEDRPVWVTMKIDWKILSYSWDFSNKHWIFKNYELLNKAKEYQKEIISMMTKNDLNKLKKEIKK